MSNIISAQDLCLWYGQFQALKNINMNIPENSITALIGPSGCGKSTFLKTLNRMNDLIPEVKITGKVTFQGKDIFAKSQDVNDLRKGQGGEISGYQTAGGCRAGQLHQPGIDFFRPVCQIFPFQGNGLGLKGGGVKHPASGFGILPLQVGEGLGIVQNPLLGAAASGHSGLLQVGAGGTVQEHGAVLQQLMKFLFCKHALPSLGIIECGCGC